MVLVWVGGRVSRLFSLLGFFFCVGSIGMVGRELGMVDSRVVYVGVGGFGLIRLMDGSLVLRWACCGAEGVVVCLFLLGTCRGGY